MKSDHHEIFTPVFIMLLRRMPKPNSPSIGGAIVGGRKRPSAQRGESLRPGESNYLPLLSRSVILAPQQATDYSRRQPALAPEVPQRPTGVKNCFAVAFVWRFGVWQVAFSKKKYPVFCEI